MKIKANRGVIWMAATVVKGGTSSDETASRVRKVERNYSTERERESGLVFRGQLYIIRKREIFSLGRPLP